MLPLTSPTINADVAVRRLRSQTPELRKSSNDTTLFGATCTAYVRASSSSWTKTAGNRYAVAFLAIGTTMPTLAGRNWAIGAVPSEPPRLAGNLAAQTDLPGTITAASVADPTNGDTPGGFLIP